VRLKKKSENLLYKGKGKGKGKGKVKTISLKGMVFFVVKLFNKNKNYNTKKATFF